ncbi:contractile injection system tape measure protein [Cellvibrio sp. NN19]|uniref:contractile injection system tape measure protein n=1 Tax=Cellvibrio chitinivorans TaxID=3102792 RepID=UPI002B417B31|nr:contractile injection system tape measure protein [Cellvibrio sp. NN19]
MQTEHRIDELIVDLSFNTTRLARHETARLSDWLSEDLLPALDQLFSRYAPGKNILRFETLEFDFGNLPSRNYQQLIRERLLQQCAQLLQSQLLAVMPTNQNVSAYEGDSPNTHRALIQLFMFLSSGHLSAHQQNERKNSSTSNELTTFSINRSTKQLASHEQLLDAVIAEQNIAELLRELPERDALIQRLLMQFSQPQRLELLRQLAPQHINNAIALLDLLQFFEAHSCSADLSISDFYKNDNRAYQKIENISLNSNTLQHNLWQVLFQLSLEYPQATDAFWLNHLLRKLAETLSLSEQQLQQAFIAIKLPANSAATSLVHLQKQIAQLLGDKKDSSESLTVGQGIISSTNYPADFVVQQNSDEQKNSEQLRQLIAAAFIRTDAMQLQQLWAQLIVTEPQLLLAAVRHYLPQAEIRQQLMLRLSLALQADIFALLSPSLKDIFYRLQNQAIALAESLYGPKYQQSTWDNSNATNLSSVSNNVEIPSKHSPELLIRQLWEIAIGMLLKNTSKNVAMHYQNHSDAFLMGLAEGYAELFNLDKKHLQQTFHTLLLDSKITNSYYPQLSDRKPSSVQHIETDFTPASVNQHQDYSAVPATKGNTLDIDIKSNVQHLMVQYSPTQRVELLRQLAPLHINSVTNLLDLIQFLELSHFADRAQKIAPLETNNHIYQQRKDKSLDSKSLQTSLWQTLLQLGLEYPQETESFWLSHILRRLATTLSLKKQQLQDAFIAIKIPAHSTATHLINLQKKIRKLLADKNDSIEGLPVAQEISSSNNSQDFITQKNIDNQKNPEELRQLIATAFIRTDTAQLQQLWTQLIITEPHLLLAAVLHYLPQAEIRQQLMLRLPQKLQADIFTLLSPSLKDIFYRLQNQATVLANLLNESTINFSAADNIGGTNLVNASGNTETPSKHSPELLIRQLWEIAIGMLLTNASTTVAMDYQNSSNTFLMELAERYAELQNLDKQYLQQVFHTLLLDQQEINHAHKQLSDHQRTSAQQLEADFTPATENKLKRNSFIPVSQSVRIAARLEASNNNQSENNLSCISDHQLFDLCLRLKSGALSWSSLASDITLLQRLISSYVRLGHSATAENCADFITAINTHADLAYSSSVFYLTVLQALIADKVIDLEAIALSISEDELDIQQQQVNTQHNAKHIQTLQQSIAPQLISARPVTDSAATISQAQNRDELISSRSGFISTATTAQLDELVVQLQQGLRQPETINLTVEQLVQLIVLLITTETFIAKDTQSDFIAAIHLHAQKTINKSNYYRQVLTQLVHKKELDLVLICAQVNHQSDLNNSTPDQHTAYAPEKISTLPIAASDVSTSDIAFVVQNLMTDVYPLTRLRSLQFNHVQWQQLLQILMQQAKFSDVNSNAELTCAIDTFAHQSINQSIFYQRLINALLQQQPLDLEMFAAATPNDEIHIAENMASITELAMSEASISEIPNSEHSRISHIATKTSATESLVSNIVNSDSREHFHSEQAIDYSLITGSDNSVHRPALLLAQLFAANMPLPKEQLLALQQHINILLNHSNQTLIAEWTQLLATPNNAQLLVQSVPAHLLHQILMRVQTTRYTWLDGVVRTVMEALALLVTDINSQPIKQVKWTFIFNYLFSTEAKSSPAKTSAHAAELALELCEQLTPVAGLDDVQRLVNLTQRRIALLKPPAQQKPTMRLQDISSKLATHRDDTTPQWEAGLHINNAGLVLAAAFLPRLFSMLNLLENGKFIHPGAADRAVHLVQFMVTGETSTPEYELILNKILCGISTSIPISAGIEINEQEQTLIEQMLTSMIQHWKVLGSTSISGLRETFFQRQGWLVLEDDCWRLKVKEQTFDMLIDHLPWSISLTKHGWMDKPLRVSWRNDS